MRRAMRWAAVAVWAVTLAGAGSPQQARAAQAEAEAAMILYVGSVPNSSGQKTEGIYRLRLDPATGALTKPEKVAEARRPSFLAIHPTRKYLYACNEIGDFEGKRAGGVSAFAIDAPESGNLTPLNDQPSGGVGPCYVRVDATGKNVLVANYGSGSVAVVPIDLATGKLKEPTAQVQHAGSSVNPDRQQGPHAHSFNPDPSNRFALACDLGLDQVLVYRFDPEKGTLAPNDPPFGKVAPGGGPRHLAFHPNGKLAYVVNEMGNTVTTFAWDGDRGTLTEIQTVGTLPADFTGSNTTAEVTVHPSGKFVYASNRGHDSIAVFNVNDATGQLTPRGQTSTQGKTPRHFTIDPTGQFLVAANQASDTLVVFRIDPSSGALSPTGSAVNVPTPTCVKFMPAEGAAP